MSKWLNHAIFYEVYPQSFMDSNGDGIGDFYGIEQKLFYIKDLGCNAIWMNPCFASSFYDAGYDIKDYYSTAPRYGTNGDLKRLIDKVHEMDMHILLDLVPGHTAVDHPWFKKSCKDERNEHSDTYIWKSPSGPWSQGYKGLAGFLSGISERPGIVGVNCYSTQVALNYGFGKVSEDWQFSWDSEVATKARLRLQDIMSFWLDLGCDGFRVDMAGSLVKEDEGKICTMKLWQKVRAFLDEKYPNAVLVSEWGDPLQSLEAGFHMDFLLHGGRTHYMDLFREEPYFSASANGNLEEFIRIYKDMYEKTNGKGLICIPSGNHDMIRMRKTLTPEEMKLAFAFLLMMPGCPFIYYGDEIGMRYVEGLKSKEGGYERTGSRTPMQWKKGRQAGFSYANPEHFYLPLDSKEDRPSVEQQIEDRDSLLWHIKDLISFRKKHSAFDSGAAFRFVTEDGGYPLVFERWNEKEHFIIAFNPSAKEVSFCDLKEIKAKRTLKEGENANWSILYSYKNPSLKLDVLKLPAGSYAILSF